MPYTLRRQAARVIVFEPSGRFLMLRASDPVKTDRGHWWEIPGGGIEHGETSEDAARRELREEAGITSAEMGPCVFTQHARFTFAGLQFDQHERIHLAWCDAPTQTWDPQGLESLEALAFEGQAWWNLDELTGTADRILPVLLRHALPDLMAGPLPANPVDITPDPDAAW
jgi:8-oxo-dGTP pyrophosphatase MutT (NUDIX family)